MTIKPITSLADLAFKVKTNKRYRQLALLGCEHYGSYNVRDYQSALKCLNKLSLHHNPLSCLTIVNGINCCRNSIKTEAELKACNSPMIKKIETPVSKKARKRKIVKIKKKI